MRKLKLFLFFTGILLSLTAAAQSEKVTKAQKNAEKTKQEQAHKAEKAELKAKKRHEAIQTKKVRKRMRKHRNGDIHVNSYENKPGFFKRLFHRRQH